jgi:NitT/TauT family transport system substrate-binding protein
MTGATFTRPVRRGVRAAAIAAAGAAVLVAGLLPVSVTTAGQAAVPAAASAQATPAASAPLVMYGARMAVELGAVHLAVRAHYPAGTTIRNGGVVNLVGPNRMADVAFNAETQTLRNSVNEPSMRVILTVAEGDYRIVARRSAGITRVADLKGKRVAAYPLTSSGYFLSKMLTRAGLSMADITAVEQLALGQIMPAVQKGQLDAVAVWEPDGTSSAQAMGADAVEFSGTGVFRELYNLNTTAAALADPARRRAIVALVRAIMDATDEMNHNPAMAAEAQAMVTKSGGIYTVEEVAASWPHVRFVAEFAGDMLDVFVEEEAWVAAQQKRQPRSRQDLATLIDRSIYDEARSSRGAR